MKQIYSHLHLYSPPFGTQIAISEDYETMVGVWSLYANMQSLFCRENLDIGLVVAFDIHHSVFSSRQTSSFLFKIEKDQNTG